MIWSEIIFARRWTLSSPVKQAVQDGCMAQQAMDLRKPQDPCHSSVQTPKQRENQDEIQLIKNKRRGIPLQSAWFHGKRVLPKDPVSSFEKSVTSAQHSQRPKGECWLCTQESGKQEGSDLSLVYGLGESDTKLRVQLWHLFLKGGFKS